MARIEYSLKATHAQTRAHNASLVLRALYDLGPISRADIARLTGLTRTSVGELVADLEAEGLARDVGRGPSTGGKAPTLVALESDARTAIVLDLGERTFSAALANLRGELTTRRTRDLDGRDGDDALALVHELIDEVSREATSPILGIGVGTPGIVDAGGTIRWAVNLEWKDLPLADLLHERYGHPTIVANDARAAALATFLFEGEDRPTNLIAIKVGRGIGTGLVLDGDLFGGDGDGAGEIGHIVVEPDGAECHCGRFGCLETVASAPAILRAATAAGLPADITLPELAAAARGRRPRRARREPRRGPGARLGHREPDRHPRRPPHRGPRLGHGPRRAVARRDPRRGDPPQPRPARPRDPHRRWRQRRGPDARRRLRAAADQRARADGPAMTSRQPAAAPR